MSHGHGERLERIELMVATLLERAAAGPAPRWLTIAGAAAHTGLCARSIRRLIARGELTAHRPVRGRLLVERLALDAVVGAATKRIRAGRGIRSDGGPAR